MDWPTPQDYNEAVQNPAIHLSDPELKTGHVETNASGLPRPTSGAFASVYHFYCGDRQWAVRCFLHRIGDHEKRYQEISNYVDHDDLECTVPFTYLPEGLRIHDTWFPMLKMEWVRGQTLHMFIQDNLTLSGAIADLARRFKDMCADLQRAGIAHGDLQHGNVMVMRDGSLRLVDYDGMYVPALRGSPSTELGHRNYQHPGRQAFHFGPYLDNFSAWVIYCSLSVVAEQPDLWKRLGGGDECMLFRQADFQDPLNSKTFSILEHHHGEHIANLARTVRALLTLPVERVPPLGAQVELPSDFQPMPSTDEIARRLKARSEHGRPHVSAAPVNQHAPATKTATAIKTAPVNLKVVDAESGQKASSSRGSMVPRGAAPAGAAPGAKHQSTQPRNEESISPRAWGWLAYFLLRVVFSAIHNSASWVWGAAFIAVLMVMVLMVALFYSSRNSHPITTTPVRGAISKGSLAQSYYQDGVQEAKSGHYAQALPLLNKAIWNGAPEAPVLVWRAFAERQLKRYDQAIADCASALKVTSQPGTAQYMSAHDIEQMALFNRGAAMVMDAQRRLTTANKQALFGAMDDLSRVDVPGFIPAANFYRGVAGALLDLNLGAIANLSKCIDSTANGPVLSPTAAQRSAKVNQDYVIEPGTKSPTLSEAYFQRGQVYFRLTHYNLAVADYSKCIALSHPAAAYFCRAGAYQQLGLQVKALADANTYVQLAPNDPKGYALRGNIETALGDLQAAAKDLAKERSLRPS
jgi:tetratricopeptide (TPR) repeat protein